MKKILYIILILAVSAPAIGESLSGVKLARVKYSGGGDWYNDNSAEVELLRFVGSQTNIDVNPVYEFVDLGSDALFNYPLLFLTGHGNLRFSDREIKNLRAYLENGGFLYVDDDYGLDKHIREEMKKVFPDNEFREIPFSHEIFNCFYNFPNGAPKIHEHDDKQPQSFGIFIDDRLAVLYTFESNPSDGWPEADVHDTPPEKRQQALKFGANIIVYALTY